MCSRDLDLLDRVLRYERYTGEVSALRECLFGVNAQARRYFIFFFKSRPENEPKNQPLFFYFGTWTDTQSLG